MTEAEWLACKDPERMLPACWPTATRRKRRLFGCSSSRMLWDKIPQPPCRAAVEVAELFADGLRTPQDLGKAEVAVSALVLGHPSFRGPWLAANWCCVVLDDELDMTGWGLADLIRHVAPEKVAEQASLLHCLFGPLSSRPAPPTPRHVTDVGLSVALAAYEERNLPSGHLDPARLAVLSDALEEAGCIEADILTHLRSPGPHVRGCWALDLVLGMG